MAKVRQRTWTVPGQRTKRRAWGFVTIENGKHRSTCADATCGGCQQVRQFRAEWSKEQAEEALSKYLLKIEPPKAATGSMTLAQACDRYLAAKARKDSIENDERIVKHLKAELGENTPLVEITAGRISAYKDKRIAAVRTIGKGAAAVERRLSAASVNRPLALLRCLLRLARDEWEILSAAPKLKLIKEPRRTRWLREDEAARLLDACRQSRNYDLVDLVEFALFTGMRRGEVLGLTWDRVDRARGVVVLEAEHAKTDEPREVRLNAHSDAVLARRWKDGAEYVFAGQHWNAYRSAWEAAVRRAKLTNLRFHDLRHTFASWLVKQGRPIKEVQEALGHKSLAMTMRYAHLAPENLRAAVASLDSLLPVSQITQEITHEPVTHEVLSPKSL